eukprot:3725473-Rhodomonas_salina.3
MRVLAFDFGVYGGAREGRVPTSFTVMAGKMARTAKLHAGDHNSLTVRAGKARSRRAPCAMSGTDAWDGGTSCTPSDPTARSGTHLRACYVLFGAEIAWCALQSEAEEQPLGQQAGDQHSQLFPPPSAMFEMHVTRAACDVTTSFGPVTRT